MILVRRGPASSVDPSLCRPPGAAAVAVPFAAIVLAMLPAVLDQTILATALLGFGMVGQVLVVTVQNSVDRRRLGVAMATTNFFRALGGAVGAAVLGAVFAARAGTQTSASAAVAQTDVIDAVQTVFIVAAPIAALALLLVLALKETPLERAPEAAGAMQPAVPAPAR
jgi:MFS family permease